MKAKQSLLLLGLAAALGGCVRDGTLSEGAVAQTYVHKYGLPVDKADWERRGENGQIVSTRKDGVKEVKVFAQGLLHGDSTYSFPHSDVVARIETYDRGMLVAEQENYPSGVPSLQRQILSSGEALETHWYSSGSPRCRETLKGGLLLAGEYFSLDNQLESRLENGEGLRTVRDAEGELLSEDQIGKGVMVRRSTFYTNGQPESISSYLEGKEHGQRFTYLPGGVPNTIECWVNGELQGITTVFVNGEKKAEIPYETGRKQGIERRYGPDGSLVEEVTWLRDMRHGADQFVVNGERTVDWYHHGQLVSKAIFDRLNPCPR
jgi:antitoxin component YwqK of YwqJK toxin-antitoxin module